MGRPYASRFVATVGWLEGRLVEGMYAHGAQALKDFGALCRQRSGEAFASGDEVKARILRDLAKELDGLSEQRRKLQAKAKADTEREWSGPVDLEAFEPLVAVKSAIGMGDATGAELPDGESVRVTLKAGEVRAIYDATREES